jgi:hypothetical protein
MLKIIIFFVALALIIYFFDRPIVPEPIERDPTALALAGQIEKCTRIYGNETTRKKNFANCQTIARRTRMIKSECVSTRVRL